MCSDVYACIAGAGAARNVASEMGWEDLGGYPHNEDSVATEVSQPKVRLTQG